MADGDFATKTCTKCKSTLPLAAFSKRTKHQDGLEYLCRECIQARNRKWMAANPDRYRELERDHEVKRRPNRAAYREKDKPRRTAYAKRWYQALKEQQPEFLKAKRAKNKARRRHVYTANEANRRAQAVMATPVWANHGLIKRFYVEAKEKSVASGIAHHVDHIVPLKGRTVCGLHVEVNLQVITGMENSRKQNLYWPDMP